MFALDRVGPRAVDHRLRRWTGCFQCRDETPRQAASFPSIRSTNLPREQIRQRIDEVYDQIVEGIAQKADAFHWTEFRSPEELGRRRLEAMEMFLADFPAGLREGRYIAAALPALPFGVLVVRVWPSARTCCSRTAVS